MASVYPSRTADLRNERLTRLYDRFGHLLDDETIQPRSQAEVERRADEAHAIAVGIRAEYRGR